MYCYLLYLGVARREFSNENLQLLLEQSRVRNELLDVTGKLIHCEGTFIQLLEGTQQIVEAIYKSIKNDDRLVATKLITIGSSRERYYKNWSMAFKDISLKEINELENCSHLDVSDYIKNASSVKLLKLLAKV